MKRSLLGLLAVLAVFSLACGLLDSEVATITYQEAIPIELSFDACELTPAGEPCPVENPVQAQEDRDLTPIEIVIPIDLIEATGNDELRDISSRLRTLEITSIDYRVSGNDLTFDLPPLDIYVSPLTINDSDAASAVYLTTIPQVPAGTNVSERASVEEASLEPASDLFKTLEFNALAEAQPRVAEGQDFPPSGSADVVITVNIRITANPIDSI